VQRERDEARLALASVAEHRSQNAAVISAVNDAIGRAGIHCAITFVEAIDQIAKERDEAIERAREGRHHVDSAMLEKRIAINAALKSGAERDALRAERDGARDGACLGVVPLTFVTCGEGGNHCSAVCALRAENASLIDVAHRSRADLLEAQAEIARLKAPRPYSFSCADCGDNIRVDEDGCCVTCGADATHHGGRP
jgi:hypothetical protein